MPNLLDRFGQPIRNVNPFREIGVSGTAVYAGYLQTKEKSSKLLGSQRYVTASDILTNTSIVAAGVRYFLNLVAKPKWLVETEDDTNTEMKEFVEKVMDSMDTSWERVIRRAGLYRFHGFGIHEWTAKKDDETGQIVIADIEVRPCHTIQRWDVDEKGTVRGVWQRSPQTGQEIGIPRTKFIYLVDDLLTDSPEGMGWFRHLVEPSERLKTYLQLEGYAFQRDLSGTPIGRAPLTKINELKKQNKITAEKATEMIDGLNRFIQTEAKKPGTSLLLDSQVFESLTADGFQAGSVPMWSVELLQGQVSSIPEVAKAIDRLTFDMARIIGIEQLLLGSDGTGSLALSKDKSHNMYLQVDSALHDMAAAVGKDVIDAIWKLNGFDEKKKPKLKTETVAFKDVEQITAGLRDMATAGAVLQPDDPAIDDVRDLLGISRQPEMTEERLADIAERNRLTDPSLQAQDADLEFSAEQADLDRQQRDLDRKAKKPRPNGVGA